MAKIRGVKPEFWTDEKIVELSRDARLLFIGLWNFACDNGHVDDKPRQIKMRIFPGDDDTQVDAWLEELVAQDRITRADGVITINRFSHHQKPHKRWWSTCDLPWCTLPDDAPPQGRNGCATVATPESNGGATADGDGEGDGDSDGEATTRRKPARPLPRDWQPNAKHVAYADEHNIDLHAQATRFRTDAEAKDKRYANWNAAFTNWLTKALEYGQTRKSKASSDPWAHVPVVRPGGAS
jgi:hypothetical protein